MYNDLFAKIKAIDIERLSDRQNIMNQLEGSTMKRSEEFKPLALAV